MISFNHLILVVLICHITRSTSTSIRFIELVEVGSLIITHKYCTNIFQPSISTSFKATDRSTNVIAATTAGDYVFSCNQTELHRYVAINPAPFPGARSTHHLLSTSLLSTSTRSSSTKYNYWSSITTQHATLKPSTTLLSKFSDPPGTVRARTSFFNEPLLYNLTNVPLKFFQFSIVGGNKDAYITLLLENSTLIVTKTNQTLLFKLILPKSFTSTINIELFINPKNISLRYNNNFKSFTPPMQSQPHHLDFRTWKKKTQLQSTGGIKTTRLDILSLLKSKYDPLRLNKTQSKTSSYYPFHDPMPAVLGASGITDEISGYDHLSLFPLGESQPLGKLGVLDVTLPPFNADPSGNKDSTHAIQFAVDFGRWHYYIVYVPKGVYKVTKTIKGVATTRMLTTGFVPGMLKHGFTRDFLLDGVSARYVPNYLHAAKGAVFKVPSHSSWFSNISNPKAVLDFRFVNPLGMYEPNENYNTVIVGLHIVVEKGGNEGAQGYRLRGAQGSGLEDVSVEFQGNSGLAGVVGGCGSGGAHHSINVTGGRYGLDLRTSQPASTVSGIVLDSQTCGAVVYRGFETLVVVGAKVTNFLGQIMIHAGYPNNGLEQLKVTDPCYLPPVDNDDQPTNGVIAGMMSWIDASFDFQKSEQLNANIVFQTNRSLFLQNVYIRNAQYVAVFPHSTVPTLGSSSSSLWTLVKQFAHGEDPDAYASIPHYQLVASSILQGIRTTPKDGNALSKIQISTNEPPTNLVSQHRWNSSSFPSFTTEGIVNVCDYGAVGDGIHDDSSAIQSALNSASFLSASQKIVFLPRGVYAVSSTINITSGVSLIGAAKHLSRIVATSNFSTSIGQVMPLVQVLSKTESNADNDTKSILAFFSITVWNSLKNVSALHWYANSGGTTRQIHFNRASKCGSSPSLLCHEPPIQINHPMMLISGLTTSLRIFTFFLEDCCRKAQFPWITYNATTNKGFWKGWLAGPQGSNYRHLKIEKSAGIDLYQMNCEHGTGDAICEIEESRDIKIYGFKTEGNTVALNIINSKNVSLFGTGGCGCIPKSNVENRSLYMIQGNSSNILLANVVGQGSHYSAGINNPFGEEGCDPSEETRVRWESGSVTSPVLDRPVVFVINDNI